MMAEMKAVSVIPLNGKNYPTWKLQCRMALIKDGLWGIVNETEAEPGTTPVEAHRRFLTRRDRALAIIVLSIEPSLLYLLGADPDDPVAVWKKLRDHFQRKTWANKLELRRKLYALRLKEGEPVQEHIKKMTELFEGLSVIDDPVSDEDRVVHLLASLPDSFGMLVTALEANSETVPRMEIVTERLLHEEQKQKEKGAVSEEQKALAAKGNLKKGPICHFCRKPGHLKRECWKLAAQSEAGKKAGKSSGKPKHAANQVTEKQQDHHQQTDDAEALSECEALVVGHALSIVSKEIWIIDSGATCHMCSDESFFSELRKLDDVQEVSLGDGRVLKATAEGTVPLEMLLPDGNTQECSLKNVLLIPKLAYNLLSVSKATEAGKTFAFSESGCEILNSKGKCIAFATKGGSLYYLQFCRSQQQLNVATKSNKERLWHRRYGHLNEQSLELLARSGLVEHLDYNVTNRVGFCEACVEGKHHRNRFETSTTHTKELLELVHTDVCGKMGAKSIGGAEYFITFIDDKSRYSWVYPMKTKDQAFDRFQEWKLLAERHCGRKLKTLRSDNGGEYTSKQFKAYLKSEGVRHEYTIPKTPEQNGVAERLNRTLIESSRSMLLDAKLPQKFWAEAVTTAMYLRNRSPTRAVDGKTPYEAWHGEKPRVKHLKVFGCDAYAHVPKDERSKLDSKARKCIMLGYGQETKGYRLYDPIRQKVLHSRDVRFNEDEKRSKDPPTGDNVRRVLLDLPCDSDSESSDPLVDAAPEQAVRRSTRERHPPDYYGMQSANLVLQSEPESFEAATTCSNSSKWTQAMESEIKSLNDNDVWDIVPLPSGKRAVGSKWVYKIKRGADGSVERYKARLVAQGFTQQRGADYDETFSPVVRMESLRVLIALSVQFGFKLHHIDVTTAFLNGDLDEEVYMKQPKGFTVEGGGDLVCRLKKSIYGLKQSSRCWNGTLNACLKDMGFTQSTSDPCIYMDTGGDGFCIGVYVDDLVLCGRSDERIREVKNILSQRFDIKDLGILHHFLGVTVEKNEEKKQIWIGQPTYTRNLLAKLGMQECKSVGTPVDVNSKLVKAVEAEEAVEQQQFQSAIGSLMYLSVCTRPDIAYAVCNLAKHTSKPTSVHWTALKRVLRYLQGTVDYGILYQDSGECIGFSDADWAGDISDRKSTSGYLFMISGGAVTWRSKKQACVALSTAEAEYIALSSAAQESVWLRRLTTELGSPPQGPTIVFEDNQSAMAMCRNPQFHGRSKHIDIKHHFVREQVASNNIELVYCPTKEMTADMFTKGLAREQFCALRSKAGIVSRELSKR